MYIIFELKTDEFFMLSQYFSMCMYVYEKHSQRMYVCMYVCIYVHRSFRNGESSFMIVTDLAARGIDIPLLNNVINFHFPPSPKLFVHRCGRAARQVRLAEG